MRVYHFVNRKYGLDDIRKRRLKVARFDDLNDPFELLCVRSSIPGVRHAIRDAKRILARHEGMLCFSRNWSNPVQWSHYAERHRGLCMGFDVPDEFLQRVGYSRRLVELIPEFRSDGVGEAHVIIPKDALFVTKYRDWCYEREMRQRVTLADAMRCGPHYFVPFSDDLRLREVIVGYLSAITRNELAEGLGELASAVSTQKARLAFESFRVVQQRKETLWE